MGHGWQIQGIGYKQQDYIVQLLVVDMLNEINTRKIRMQLNFFKNPDNFLIRPSEGTVPADLPMRPIALQAWNRGAAIMTKPGTMGIDFIILVVLPPENTDAAKPHLGPLFGPWTQDKDKDGLSKNWAEMTKSPEPRWMNVGQRWSPKTRSSLLFPPSPHRPTQKRMLKFSRLPTTNFGGTKLFKFELRPEVFPQKHIRSSRISPGLFSSCISFWKM
jgi:hypothetical protein